MLEQYINHFNTVSNSITYRYTYYILGIIAFIFSYICQYLIGKPCNNLSAIIIRTIHHFLIFFIYFGFLAPVTNILFISILVGTSLLSWLLNKNYCILTILENKICGLSKTHVFRDITYYLSKDFDKFLSYTRIYLISCTFLIILLRLYFYYYKSKKIDIQGHRGARGNYPENTLSGFKYVLDNNINTLELDLQITKDNEFIIYHNKDIDQNICMNGPIVSVKNLTLEEIKKYDCGSKQHPNFKNQITVLGEQIPTFKELINMVNNDYYFKIIDIKFNVEIKTDKQLDSDDEVKHFVEQLIHFIHDEHLQNKIIVQSFDSRALEYMKQFDQTIKTSYLIRKTTNIDDTFLTNAKKLGVKIISPEYILVNKEIVNTIHEQNFEVLPWMVNDIDTFKKMIEYKVDGIITDYPVMLNDYLKTI